MPFIVSRENLRSVFLCFSFYSWGLWILNFTVSSNKKQKGCFCFPLICMSEIIVLKWAQTVKLHWILHVSDPINKFRGIKKRSFFLLIKLWEPEEFLWPPVTEQNAPGTCSESISVLLETSLAVFGEGNVKSIVLLGKNKKCKRAHFIFLSVQLKFLFVFYILIIIVFFFYIVLVVPVCFQ